MESSHMFLSETLCDWWILKSCNCVKSTVDDLVITCDEIMDMSETVLINFHDRKTACKMDYHILHTFN